MKPFLRVYPHSLQMRERLDAKLTRNSFSLAELTSRLLGKIATRNTLSLLYAIATWNSTDRIWLMAALTRQRVLMS